jgi:mono/diheme cytochrome c family protein
MVSGQSAEAYLRESIVDPDAYVVEGFTPGIMPSNYRTQLSDEQITDLVVYLMSLDQRSAGCSEGLAQTHLPLGMCFRTSSECLRRVPA